MNNEDKLEDLKKQYSNQYGKSGNGATDHQADENQEEDGGFFGKYTNPPKGTTPQRTDASTNSAGHGSAQPGTEIQPSNDDPAEQTTTWPIVPPNKTWNTRRKRARETTERPSIRIPWRLAAALVAIACIIAAALAIWNARYAILASVEEFLEALLPIVIAIGATIYCFKVLITGKW